MRRPTLKAESGGVPLRCIVDTNVATTANGANSGAPPSCVAASAVALQQVMTKGHVFLDAGRRIVHEYGKNLSGRGQPGAGDVFYKWILTNEWAASRVTLVSIRPKEEDPEDFHELRPADPDVGKYGYDRSDRKFLAVAAAHPENPPILQSFDSKWWGWTKSLRKDGVSIHFLCPKAIKAKHEEKMGT